MDSADLSGCVTAFELTGQDELAACYRHLARHRRGIFALTATFEPFGLGPLEAMASGLPAVVTQNGGPSESLRDEEGQYGLLVDPDDPDSVAAALTRLAGDDDLWRAMQGAGSRRITDRYTWTRTAAGYMGVFEELAHDVGPPEVGLRPPNGEGGVEWLEKLYFGDGAGAGNGRRGEA